jgi:PAS domain S-box-containing protein
MRDEIRRLRVALRDLVAMSTLPAAWVGREPDTIAMGLADVLGRALQLDFVFVRLRDRSGNAPIDVTQGTAWAHFPEWLEGHAATVTRNSRGEFISDVGHSSPRYRGLAIPIGFDADSGLVATASDRADFPTETDRLLLSVATNHAAMAFESARLVRDLRLAEDRLRQAGDELETNVRERTRELRRTSTELQTILDASPLGMLLVRRDQTVQRWNPALERLVGWSSDEVIGQRVPLTQTIAAEWTRRAAQFENGHGFSGIEIRMTRKDGSEFDAALACAPLADEQGYLAGLVASIEDISDRKRSEQALHKAQAELAHITRLTTLGEMAASIAHEINQPLTAIVANATASLNWLARRDVDFDAMRGALADIVSDGHRAGDVIQRIRQLATKGDPKKSELNVNDVIQDVVTLVRSEVQKHGVSLCTELASPIQPVLADRVQLQQVIINLVMNGAEAMAAVHDRPRDLVIRSGARDDRVLVAVEDTGVGLDPSHGDRLFSAFFTTKPGGMGMGLSISRSIIEGHGGRLWATPNVDYGATFAFALPIKD